jgi:large subunit ribosomal protein L22
MRPAASILAVCTLLVAGLFRNERGETAPAFNLATSPCAKPRLFRDGAVRLHTADRLVAASPIARSADSSGYGGLLSVTAVALLAVCGGARHGSARRRPAAASAVAVRASAKDDDIEDVDDLLEAEGEDPEEVALGPSDGDGRLIYGEDFEDLEDDEMGLESRITAHHHARFLKGSPQKFRRVLWQIKKRSYRDALIILEFLPWRACRPVLSALQSAAASAQNHYNLDKSRLVVVDCRANKGPVAKRARFRSKGSIMPIKRPTTHLSIWVAEGTDREYEDFRYMQKLRAIQDTRTHKVVKNPSFKYKLWYSAWKKLKGLGPRKSDGYVPYVGGIGQHDGPVRT